MKDKNTFLCFSIAEKLGMRGFEATNTSSSVLKIITTTILSTITTMIPTTTTPISFSPRISSTTSSSATNSNKINTNPSESSPTISTSKDLQPDTFELELADMLNTNMDNEFDTEPMATDENNKRHNTDSNKQSINKPTKPNPVNHIPANNPIQSSPTPQTTPTPLLSNPSSLRLRHPQLHIQSTRPLPPNLFSPPQPPTRATRPQRPLQRTSTISRSPTASSQPSSISPNPTPAQPP